MFSYFNHVTKTEHQRGKATGPQSQSTSARIYLFNFWVIFIHYLVFAFQALFDLKFLLQLERVNLSAAQTLRAAFIKVRHK